MSWDARDARIRQDHVESDGADREAPPKAVVAVIDLVNRIAVTRRDIRREKEQMEKASVSIEMSNAVLREARAALWAAIEELDPEFAFELQQQAATTQNEASRSEW